MNNLRRKKIKNVINDIYAVIENIRDDEQDAFDNMPEGLQCSRNGENSQECIDNMDEALELLEDVISLLEEVII